MQHLISEYRGEDVADEVSHEDVLHGAAEGGDVGSLGARRFSVFLALRDDLRRIALLFDHVLRVGFLSSASSRNKMARGTVYCDGSASD